MSGPNEHLHDTETEESASAGGFGTPGEIVAHIDLLGELYSTLGLDRDGTPNQLGDELIREGFDATRDLLKAEGLNIADAVAFASVARSNLAEAARRIPNIARPDDEEATLLQLELADRLLARSLETIAKIHPDLSRCSRVVPSHAELN